MATIKIRGRTDSIYLDDERAKKIKDRKFGTPLIAKADANELIDLGDWSGEYGRIIEIEISKKEQEDWRAVERRAQKEQDERLLARPLSVRSRELGWFKLAYSTRTGDFKWQPGAELAEKVIELQTRYFTEHPGAFTVPTDVYGDLLPRKSGVLPIAVSKRVDYAPEDLAF